jgi:hypothetical protein
VIEILYRILFIENNMSVFGCVGTVQAISRFCAYFECETQTLSGLFIAIGMAMYQYHIPS